MEKRGKLRGFINSFWYCGKLSWKAAPFYTLLQLLFKSVQAILPVAVVWLTKEILNCLMNHDKRSGGMLQGLFCLLLLVYILQAVSRHVINYLDGMQRDVIIHYIESIIAQKAAAMDVEYYDNPKYYDIFENVKRNSHVMAGVIDNCMMCIGFAVSVISCICFLKEVLPFYAALIMIATIPVAVSQHRYTRKIYRWGLEHTTSERRKGYLYGVLTERSYAQTVRLFGIGDYFTEKYELLWKKLFEKKRNIIRKKLVWNLLFSIMPEIILICATVSISRNVLAGKNTIGDFSLCLGLIAQLTGVLHGLVSAVMNVYENNLKVEYFMSFDRFRLNKIVSGNKMLETPVKIEFQNVSFQYPGTREYVLKNISFCLEPYKKLCIVGENGSGKSTLLKLLLRFYEVSEGTVYLNDLPIKEYDVNSLRKTISCFFQNSPNFAFTIKDNIRLGEYDMPAEDCDERERHALRLAGADGFVDRLSHKENTYITKIYEEDGMELSGGQSQKVALARMFYKRASVLLLDEPTAALDPKGEHELFESLKRECSGQSVIFISHRLSNVFLADEIMVLENGKICAQGKHEELLRSCMLYKQLYDYQADKYL